MTVIKAQGFNKLVVALAHETEAHSDDELTDSAEVPVYHIKEKAGRSQKVTKFFRMADVQRQRMAQSKSRHYRYITIT